MNLIFVGVVRVYFSFFFLRFSRREMINDRMIGRRSYFKRGNLLVYRSKGRCISVKCFF